MKNTGQVMPGTQCAVTLINLFELCRWTSEEWSASCQTLVHYGSNTPQVGLSIVRQWHYYFRCLQTHDDSLRQYTNELTCTYTIHFTCIHKCNSSNLLHAVTIIFYLLNYLWVLTRRCKISWKNNMPYQYVEISTWYSGLLWIIMKNC